LFILLAEVAALLEQVVETVPDGRARDCFRGTLVLFLVDINERDMDEYHVMMTRSFRVPHEDFPGQQFQALFELEARIGFDTVSAAVLSWHDPNPGAMPNVLQGAITYVSSLTTQDNNDVGSLAETDSTVPTTGTGSA
jgi:hypothetical protein